MGWGGHLHAFLKTLLVVRRRPSCSHQPSGPFEDEQITSGKGGHVSASSCPQCSNPAVLTARPGAHTSAHQADAMCGFSRATPPRSNGAAYSVCTVCIARDGRPWAVMRNGPSFLLRSTGQGFNSQPRDRGNVPNQPRPVAPALLGTSVCPPPTPSKSLQPRPRTTAVCHIPHLSPSHTPPHPRREDRQVPGLHDTNSSRSGPSASARCPRGTHRRGGACVSGAVVTFGQGCCSHYELPAPVPSWAPRHLPRPRRALGGEVQS